MPRRRRDHSFKLIGSEGRIDVGAFVGDFKADRGTHGGAGGERGRQVETATFPMTRRSARRPDFYARYAAAYVTELAVFVDCIRKEAPFDPDPDLGWKTLYVANLAEASSRSGGRRIDLAPANGSPIAAADDAA